MDGFTGAGIQNKAFNLTGSVLRADDHGQVADPECSKMHLVIILLKIGCCAADEEVESWLEIARNIDLLFALLKILRFWQGRRPGPDRIQFEDAVAILALKILERPVSRGKHIFPHVGHDTKMEFFNILIADVDFGPRGIPYPLCADGERFGFNAFHEIVAAVCSRSVGVVLNARERKFACGNKIAFGMDH